MAEYLVKSESLTKIADAIRQAETGSSSSTSGEALTLAEMPNKIKNLVTTVTSTGNATEEQILLNRKAWVNGKQIVGRIPVIEGKEITPSVNRQTAINAGEYALGAITVAGDPNLKAENIKKGVSIFGVEGSCAGGEWYVPAINQTRFTPSLISSFLNGAIDFSSLENAGEGYYSYYALFNSIGELASPQAPQDIEEKDITVVGEDQETLTISVKNENPKLYLYAYFSLQEEADQKYTEEYGAGYDRKGVILRVPPSEKKTAYIDGIFEDHHYKWYWYLEGIRYSLI